MCLWWANCQWHILLVRRLKIVAQLKRTQRTSLSSFKSDFKWLQCLSVFIGYDCNELTARFVCPPQLPSARPSRRCKWYVTFMTVWSPWWMRRSLELSQWQSFQSETSYITVDTTSFGLKTTSNLLVAHLSCEAAEDGPCKDWSHMLPHHFILNTITTFLGLCQLTFHPSLSQVGGPFLKHHLLPRRLCFGSSQQFLWSSRWGTGRRRNFLADSLFLGGRLMLGWRPGWSKGQVQRCILYPSFMGWSWFMLIWHWGLSISIVLRLSLYSPAVLARLIMFTMKDTNKLGPKIWSTADPHVSQGTERLVTNSSSENCVLHNNPRFGRSVLPLAVPRQKRVGGVTRIQRPGVVEMVERSTVFQDALENNPGKKMFHLAYVLLDVSIVWVRLTKMLWTYCFF